MAVMQQQTHSSPADEEILACIDRGLESVGSQLRNVIYWHLDKISHISKHEVVEKPSIFVQGLRSIYRESSAGVENAILRELNSKFNLNYSYGADLDSAIIQARSKSQSKEP